MAVVKVNLGDLSVTQKFYILSRQLKRECLEREYAVDSVLALLISKQHGLMLGPPGTGKSMLLRLICESVIGANFFSRLIGEDTRPEELFGPISAKGLREEEKYERVLRGRLPEAHIAFLDEIFKAPGACHNSLLGIMNERIFENGTQQIKVPLRMAVGASNELPEGEDNPFLDRFAWKIWVDYLSPEGLTALLKRKYEENRKCAVTVKLTIPELDEALALAKKIKVDHVIGVVVKVNEDLKSANLSAASDRRMGQILDFLQAFAWVRGEKKVTLEIIKEVMPDCIWQNKEDIQKIKESIHKSVNGYANALTEIREQVEASKTVITVVLPENSVSTEDKVNTCLKLISNLEVLESKLANASNSGFFSQESIDILDQDIKDVINLVYKNMQKYESEKADSLLDNYEHHLTGEILRLTSTSLDARDDQWLEDVRAKVEELKGAIAFFHQNKADRNSPFITYINASEDRKIKFKKTLIDLISKVEYALKGGV